MYKKLENGNSKSRSILHSCGELYDEDDRFCVKCSDKRRSTPNSEGDKGLQERIQRF